VRGPSVVVTSTVTTSLRIIDALEPHSKGRTGMASNGKKKTTMAKLNRENRVRERRADKAAKKDARKRAAIDQPAGPIDVLASDAHLTSNAH
jgi:hypothetical protein